MNHPVSEPALSPRAQALEELRRKVHSPEGDKGDVEALCEALRQPVEPGEEVHGLAEVLNHLIEDALIGGMRGNSGSRVDVLAVRALMALGEPHASTLSDTAREVLERENPVTPSSTPEGEGDGSPEQGTARAERLLLGVPLAVCCFALAVYEAQGVLSTQRGGDGSRGIVVLFSLVTLVGPGLVFVLRSPRWMYGLAAALMVGVCGVMAVPLIFILYSLWTPGWFLTELLVSRSAITLMLFLVAVLWRGDR